MTRWRSLLAIAALVMLAACAGRTSAAAPAYDPLAVEAGFEPTIVDLDVVDTARQRTIPIRVFLPAATDPRPVVFFSHGLGGSREGCAYLGRHWSARGYVAVFLQHPGSDTSVWRGAARDQRLAAMRAAASGENFLLRVRDVPAVIDQLTTWTGTEGHELDGRLDLERLGMSGHSFGAVTTQAVSGQTFLRQGAVLTDPRIDAAIAFSPSAPMTGQGGPERAFGQVAIPWLLMTGTKDTSIINDTTVDNRLSVYPALPPGDKYEVVLWEALHSAFADSRLPGEGGTRNPNHHRVILALSTAFWDTYLRGDEAARAWLTGDGPRGVMVEQDRWQTK